MSIIITRDRKDAWLLRGGLAITMLLYFLGVLQLRSRVIAVGYWDASDKWRLGISILLLANAFFLLLTVLAFSKFGLRLGLLFHAIQVFFAKLGRFCWLLFTGSNLLFAFIVVGPLSNIMSGVFTRAFFVWIFGWISFASMRILLPGKSWQYRVTATLLPAIAILRIGSFLPGITNYPFSLAWGESSNINNASLFLGQKLFGFPTTLPMINSGRALLSAVPFLLPVPQIWVNRLWDALLWVGLTGLTAYLVRRRLPISNRLDGLLFVLWASLFLFQGPIYYELLLQLIIVLWLFDARRFWRTMIAVGVASLWAGVCRINWFPMPGLTAACLYLLETPRGTGPFWKYLAKPFFWAAAGLVLAFSSLEVYTAISGNGTSFALTSMSSPLLWYRLFPNTIQPLGVLGEALITALPLLILIITWLNANRNALSPWRKLGIFAILAVFFFGGLVVSAKIGGGVGIHNLDAFWFLLLLVGCYFFFNRSASDDPAPQSRLTVSPVLLAAILAIPCLSSLSISVLRPDSDMPHALAVIDQMHSYLDPLIQSGQQVLFIDNKQLIPFGYFPQVKTVPRYETVLMLEMAMSGNHSYFQTFQAELKTKKYGAIVIYPVSNEYQNPDHPFSEENNVQVTDIIRPLACTYQRVYTSLALNVEIWEPAAESPGACN